MKLKRKEHNGEHWMSTEDKCKTSIKVKGRGKNKRNDF